MKKYTFKYLIIALAGSFLFSACDDNFIERYPLDQEVSSSFYQDEDDAMQALVAVYDVFGHDAATGISWCPFVTVADILSDDSFAGGADSNDGSEQQEMNTYNTQTNNPIAHALWAKNYKGIYRANQLLEKIDEMDVTDEFKTRVVAECKFFRAYFHYDLVRFFENIPLMTFTIKGPSEYSQPQAPVADVYNQIALDLVEAESGLPETLTSDEYGRVTKWAAQAMLARVYLFYNGVYNADLVAGSTTINGAAALAKLEDLITNSGHDLFPDYATNFKLAGEFGIESVLEVSYGDSPVWWDWEYTEGGEGNLGAQMQGPRVSGSDNWNRGWSFAPVSQKLYDDLAGDPRQAYTILTEAEIDGTVTPGYQHTGYFSRKYSSDAEHWGSGGQFELNRTCNFRVIRYSDVLLMAAELGSANAQTYLDKVRARVGLASIPATEENIYNERRLELSLEGIRYFDVIRKGRAFAQQEFTVTDLRGANYVEDQIVYDHTFTASSPMFLPIPISEMDLMGDSWTQNEGY